MSNSDTFKGRFSVDFHQRSGVLTRWSTNGLKTQGHWVNGKLEGIAWIDNEYGGYEEAFFKQGVRHGPSRSFGPCPHR